MIGKPKWFRRRKYTGWGLWPITWQGWVYTAAIVIPFILFQSLPHWDIGTKKWLTIGWAAFILLDITHIMFAMKNDEREQKIEALSERNAAWVMVLLIGASLVYQITANALQKGVSVDWLLFAVLIGGMLAKTISNLYYKKVPL